MEGGGRGWEVVSRKASSAGEKGKISQVGILSQHRRVGKLTVEADCCMRCLQKGHWASSCRNGVRCLLCGGIGHRRWACSQGREEKGKGPSAEKINQGGACFEKGSPSPPGADLRIVDIPLLPMVAEDRRWLEQCDVVQIQGLREGKLLAVKDFLRSS